MCDDCVEPEDAGKSQVHEHTGKQCSCRSGSSILGIDSRGKHGYQPEFGGETGKNEEECQFQPEGIQRAAVRHQVREGKILRTCILQGKTKKENADKNKRDTQGTDKHILPGTLQRQLIPVMVYQSRSTQRGQFGKDPDHGNVIGQVTRTNGGDQQNQRCEINRPGRTGFLVPFNINFTVPGCRNCDDAQSKQQEDTQCVKSKIAVFGNPQVCICMDGKTPLQDQEKDQQHVIDRPVAVDKKPCSQYNCGYQVTKNHDFVPY